MYKNYTNSTACVCFVYHEWNRAWVNEYPCDVAGEAELCDRPAAVQELVVQLVVREQVVTVS